jgi:hypothetical protein
MGNWLPGLGEASPDDLASWTAEKSSWYLASSNHEDIQDVSEVESDQTRSDLPADMRFQDGVY